MEEVRSGAPAAGLAKRRGRLSFDPLEKANSYHLSVLGTFQVLGGLGLLLGSVGLGVVVLRNVLERRGELAVLLAVGFRKRTLQRLLLIENGSVFHRRPSPLL